MTQFSTLWCHSGDNVLHTYPVPSSLCLKLFNKFLICGRKCIILRIALWDLSKKYLNQVLLLVRSCNFRQGNEPMTQKISNHLQFPFFSMQMFLREGRGHKFSTNISCFNSVINYGFKEQMFTFQIRGHLWAF